MEHADSKPAMATTAMKARTFDRIDSALGQSLGDVETSPEPPASLLLSPASPNAKFQPTIICLPTADAALPPARENGIVIKSMCQTDNHGHSSKCRVVGPHSHGPDSACCLTPFTTQSKVPEDASASAARPAPYPLQLQTRNSISHNVSEQLQEAPRTCWGKCQSPFCPNEAAHSGFCEAHFNLSPRIDSGCCGWNRPHAREFARIRRSSDIIWVHGTRQVDLQRVLGFPPPERTEDDRQFREHLEESSPKHIGDGFNMDSVWGLVETCSRDSSAYAALTKKDILRSEALQEASNEKLKVSLHLQTQISLLTLSLADKFGTEAAARVKKQLLNHLEAAKATVDLELAELDQKLRDTAKQAKQTVQNQLLYDFDPATTIAVATRKKAQADKKAEENEKMKLWWHSATPLTVRKEEAKGSGGCVGPNEASLDRASSPDTPDKSPDMPYKIINHVKVPSWFTVLDAKGTVKVVGEGQRARFEDFMSHLQRLHTDMTAEQNEPVKKPSQKEWHDANNAWPYDHWRRHGGWWTCRSGEDASEAERRCRTCHKRSIPARSSQTRARTRQSAASSGEASQSTASQTKWPATATEDYKNLISVIEKAMNEVLEEDKKALKARMKLRPDSQPKQRNQDQDKTQRANTFIIGPDDPAYSPPREGRFKTVVRQLTAMQLDSGPGRQMTQHTHRVEKDNSNPQCGNGLLCSSSSEPRHH
ncbi:hypothetical protein B0H66DRAFT_236057 [Apodospora peruviana]|uniref:Uncharacterized protein n=1 Tax=Apodospora peruviana TaxID=516989 RepID=A0AAE0I566_9PEZI|nr:hypothetical protein B0H66DRAFT_236057 [Apodospora peruviana]